MLINNTVQLVEVTQMTRLFTDDNDVIVSKASHVTGSAQVNGLERWNSYESFSGLSTSMTALSADGTCCTLNNLRQ